MQNSKNPFRIKEPVCDETYNKRSDDGAPGLCRKCCRDLYIRSIKIVTKKSSESNEPSSPNEEFKEHHQGKLKSNKFIHDLKIGVYSCLPALISKFLVAMIPFSAETSSPSNSTPMKPSYPLFLTI